MCKRAAINRNIRTCIIRLLLCLLLAVSVLACSGGGGGSSSNSSSSGTGGIAFGLAWKGNVVSNVQQGPVREAVICGSGTGQVQTVTAYVYNDSLGGLVAQGGPWACSAGSGTIGNLTPGDGYYVEIGAQDSGSNIAYLGSVSNISVKPGQVSNAGTVPMYFTSNIDSFTVVPENPTINLSSPQPLSVLATFYDPSTQNDYQLDISNWMTYSSLDPSIATVDSLGMIKAVSPGETIITVTSSLPDGSVHDIPVIVGLGGPTPYKIKGYVTCNNANMDGITVTCNGTDRTSQTKRTSSGYYEFDNLNSSVSYTLYTNMSCNPFSETLAPGILTPSNPIFSYNFGNCCENYSGPVTKNQGCWSVSSEDDTGTCTGSGVSYPTATTSFSTNITQDGFGNVVYGTYDSGGVICNGTIGTTSMTMTGSGPSPIPCDSGHGCTSGTTGCYRQNACTLTLAGTTIVTPSSCNWQDYCGDGTRRCTGTSKIVSGSSIACSTSTSTIAGQVFSPNGSADSVSVCLGCLSPFGCPSKPCPLTTSANSDKYQFAALPSGSYTITATKTGYCCTPYTPPLGSTPWTNPVTVPPTTSATDFSCTKGSTVCLAGSWCVCPSTTPNPMCNASTCPAASTTTITQTSAGNINTTLAPFTFQIGSKWYKSGVKCSDTYGGKDTYIGNVGCVPPIVTGPGPGLEAIYQLCNYDPSTSPPTLGTYAGHEVITCGPTINIAGVSGSYTMSGQCQAMAWDGHGAPIAAFPYSFYVTWSQISGSTCP